MKLRMKFTKTNNAKFISHLDLNRAFVRAFARAGIAPGYTGGFNPHPYFVFTQPLSLGFSGKAEFLDFEADEYPDTIRDKLNQSLPEGIEVLEIYEPYTRFSEISFFRYEIFLNVKNPVAENVLEKCRALFEKPEIIVLKKGKKGESNFDIIPLIDSISFSLPQADQIKIEAILSCGENKTLNPEYVIAAIKENIARLSIDSSDVYKTAALCSGGEIFR